MAIASLTIMASPQKQNLFGIRTLIILTTLAALVIVGCGFLVNRHDNSYSMITAGIIFTASAGIGLTAIGYSILSAILVATSNKPRPVWKRKLRACFQLFVFGIFASLPAFAITLIGILH